MFILVLHLLTYWKWADQTEKINMGLPFAPYTFSDNSRQDMVFTDIDLDGDEDMIMATPQDTVASLRAFENIITTTGKSWRENPAFLKGIDQSLYVRPLAVADLNADGRDELLYPGSAYVNRGTSKSPLWVKDTTLFGSLKIYEPDFADIDKDGDLDMVTGGYWLTLWWNTGTPKHPKWQMDTTYFWNKEWNEPNKGNQPKFMDWDGNGVIDLLIVQKYIIMDNPEPDPGSITLMKNIGTTLVPEWGFEDIYEDFNLGCVAWLDWNLDGIEDLLIQGNVYDGGYRYYQGKIDQDGWTYSTDRMEWGGINGTYPAAADVNDDDIPEITIIEYETHVSMPEWGFMWEYTYPHLRFYSPENEFGTLWKCTKHSGYRGEPWCDYGYSLKKTFQYVDFTNNGLIDYVITQIERKDDKSEFTWIYALYRNQGTNTEPSWVADTDALADLPPLFQACFVDVDGDGDKDVIGVPAGDSFPKGFLNTGSDKHPSYAEYPALVAGLENVKPSYISAGDITDNDLSLPDLVVGVKGGNITAFFNTGNANPRWTRHDEVFAGLGISGNPCLADMDADKKLDLFVSVNNTLRYYHNESTGGIEEAPSTPSGLSVTCLGRVVELRFNADSRTATNTKLFLYDASGRRVSMMTPVIEGDATLFRITGEAYGSGVYFYRIVSGADSYKGKIVLY